MERLQFFESERDRLSRIAARILGSAFEADDVLQEAQIRLSNTDNINDVRAWLTTVVTRLCLDHLRKRANRSTFESAAASVEFPPIELEADVVLAEQVGVAMQVVLDSLAPAERVAFVLHDIFGYSFEEISAVLGRSVTAVRQLASRARRKTQGLAEPVDQMSARTESRGVVEAFLAAARGGDLEVLMSLLAPNAVMRADVVGHAMGAERIYDGAAAVAARLNGARGAVPVFVDTERGAAWIAAGVIKAVFVFHVEAGLVSEIELIADPEVLANMTINQRHVSPDAAANETIKPSTTKDLNHENDDVQTAWRTVRSDPPG